MNTVTYIKSTNEAEFYERMKKLCDDNYKGWINEIDEFALKQFFRHLLKESITDAPKEQYQVGSAKKYLKDYYGWVHMCNLEYSEDKKKHSKTPLNRPKKVVRCLSSLWNTIKYDPNYIWFCPHTFSTRRAYPEKIRSRTTGKLISDKGGRKEKYIRWINAIFIDIDNLKFDTTAELISLFTAVNMPEPTVINETTSGYHVYWLLDERVPGTPKAKKLYKLIMSNIQLALNTKIPLMDTKVKDLPRYMQVPHNIIYSNYSNMVSFRTFKNWVNEYGQDNFKTRLKAKNNKIKKNKTKSYKTNKDHIDENTNNLNQRTLDLVNRIYWNKVEEGNRHSACFTLSMFYKLIGYSKEKSLDTLLKWNGNHSYDVASKPHHMSEVESTVTNVYDNNYPWGYFINNLKDITGEKIVAFNNHALTRKERKNKGGYSHYSEWINDIVTFLCNNEIGVINGSQVELAEMFSMPLSTFKEIVKRLKNGEFNDLITIDIVGKGRYATTFLKLTAETVTHFNKGTLNHYIATFIFINDFLVINSSSQVQTIPIDCYNKASP